MARLCRELRWGAHVRVLVGAALALSLVLLVALLMEISMKPYAFTTVVLMTMGVDVADKKMLDGLKVGDKVRFQAEMVKGKAMVTELKKASR